jgi:hypothetical protein
MSVVTSERIHHIETAEILHDLLNNPHDFRFQRYVGG